MGREEIDIAPVVKDLIRGIGTEENARIIFVHYYPLFVRFFIGRGLRFERAEELAQESLLNALHQIRTFRWESNFDTWIFKIRKHAYLNELRRLAAAKRQAMLLSIDIVEWDNGKEERVARDVNPTAEEILIRKEELALAIEALNSLPNKMRQCVTLRALDFRYQEIANLLQISIGTVKSHLHEARKKLREQLGKRLGEFDL